MKKLIFLLPLFLLACSQNDEDLVTASPVEEQVVPIEYKPLELTYAQKNMAKKLNGFSLKLLENIIGNTEDNTVISPLSLTSLLSMVSNGASDDALNEILDAFNVNDLEALNELNTYLLSHLPGQDNQVKFNMNNSLWINKDFSVFPEFCDKVNDEYGAELFTENLNSKEGLDKINNWVNEKTSGMIKEFLEGPIMSGFTMINTSYFKGGWTVPFEIKNTFEDTFTAANGSVSKVATMHSDFQALSYGIGNNYTTVSKPYGNSAFFYQIILPNEGKGIDDALTDYINGEAFWGSTQVKISLPKHTIRYRDENVEKYIKNIGINKIFTETGSLNRLSSMPMKLNQVLQETMLIVDETGSEAAAASGLLDPIAPPPMGPMPENVDFKVNRPFIFLIKEKSSGSILFAGVIRNLK